MQKDKKSQKIIDLRKKWLPLPVIKPDNMKFKYLEYFNTSWSLLAIVVTLFQWILDAPWFYIVLSLIIFIAIWIAGAAAINNYVQKDLADEKLKEEYRS